MSQCTSYKKLKLAGFCEKPTKTKIKITRYHHKNPGKYREVFKTILGVHRELRIFTSTLFNTGGMDLPGARDV